MRANIGLVFVKNLWTTVLVEYQLLDENCVVTLI